MRGAKHFAVKINKKRNTTRKPEGNRNRRNIYIKKDMNIIITD